MAPKLKLKTKEELNSLLLFLDIAEKKIFKKGVMDMSKFEEKWGHYPWFDQVQGIIGHTASGGYDEKLPAIEEINNWARGLEQVKLIMPFQPSQKFIDDVYAAIEPSEPLGFILDVVVDKKIASGGRLFHKGRYIDLTLKSRIGDLFNKEDDIGKYL